MSFVSKLALKGGKIGKIAGEYGLKYGTAFIPGVGPLVSMGINAGTSAADAKAKGGSWKDALLAGGISAGTSYLGGKIPGLDKAVGIGPSSYVRDQVAGVANKVSGGGGFKAGLGKVLSGMASGGGSSSRIPGASGGGYGGGVGQQGGGWQEALGGILGDAISRRGSSSSDQYRTPDFNPNAGGAVSRPAPGTGGGSMPRGGFKYDENPLNQYDQTTPNLAMALHQGRQEALRNQPFRSGYQTNTLGTDKETMFTSQMPKLYSGFGSGQKKRRNTTQDQEASR